MKIPLFLPDFKSLVRREAFGGENSHPLFYYETDAVLNFYKPIDGVLYCTELTKGELPEGLTPSGLKREFNAIELSAEPDLKDKIKISVV